MPTYSIYQAKARLSELIRLVKSGKDVIVTERGEPVAKVTRIAPPPTDLLARVKSLKLSGQIKEGTGKGLSPKGEKRPGALKRFLKDRQ